MPAAAVLGAAILGGVGAAPAPATAAPALAIAVEGNHFVNGAGQTVRLLGVDVPGTEYACEEGWGYAQEPLTAATAQAIAAWHADAVRVPLNEDCWLGLNGQPSYGTEAGYRSAIESWVAALNAAGLYAVLDLHWSAPGSVVADGQRPMPDDHSAAFWTSVAGAFAGDPAVVFDAFNEPYSPAADGDSTLAVSWSCWRDGGCAVPVAADGTTPDDADTYQAVGMQTLVDAIRATGADQPILLGGLSYANDLSGWSADEPTDPAGQLAASFHNYYGEACDTASCWNSTVAPVAAVVPVVTGEFDQGYDCADPPTGPPGLTGFDTTYMQWADAAGVSYLAWGWWVLGDTATACSALSDPSDNYALVSDQAGTPVAPDGLALFQHLRALAGSGSGSGGGLAVATASLPAGTVGARYTARLSATGGTGPARWSVVSGRLPLGLHLRARSGTISGRPRAEGRAAFTVEVRVKVKAEHEPVVWETATRGLSLTVS